MARLLGLDIGTSGCRALVIDETGAVVQEANHAYAPEQPHEGWSEQDPAVWLQGVGKCLSEIGERRFDAIGLTGQMHGAVFLDSSGSVIRPAILWNDQRTVAECREIDQVVGKDRVRAITCNPPLTGFQLPKLLWLRNHEPERFDQVRKVLLPKDYISFCLSKEFATDVSDASGTGAFDVPNRSWSSEILTGLNLSHDLLPTSFESSEITASTSGFELLDDGIPIVAGAGDQAASAVGTGVVAPGEITISLGTSGVVSGCLPSPRYATDGSAHTFAHANGSWHAMGVMLSCGGAIKWFRDTFMPDASYNAVAEVASRASSSTMGPTFLPYLTGERSPHNDPFARGTWAGISLSHGLPEMARSVFEGVTFGLQECLQSIENLGATGNKIRVTGGGARNDFWTQMLANVLNRECCRMEIEEGPAYGAAILAGVGIGVWPDLAAATQCVVREAETFSPQGTDYSARAKEYTDLYSSVKPWNCALE